MLKYILFPFLFIVTSCDNGLPKQEVLVSSRGVGASSLPLVSEPSNENDIKTVVVTFFLSIPLSEEFVSATPYVDLPTANAYMASEEEMTVIENSVQTDSYAQIKIVQFNMSVVVPQLSILETLSFGTFEGKQVRYGALISTTTQTEKIIGSYLVYPSDSVELSWESPTATLSEPQNSISLAAASDIDISLDIEGGEDEEFKYGWFVSGGTVLNRRAKNTQWTTPGFGGTQTVVATVRGKRSRSFAFDVVDVSIE